MAAHRAGDRVLCMSRTYNVPLRYILGPLRERIDVRLMLWEEAPAQDWESLPARSRGHDGDVERAYAHEIHIGRPNDEREYPRTVTFVSPRMLWDLLRAPERVVLTRELNLATLYAVMSKVRRGRRVVAMVEGDFTLLGTTGSASYKVALRRLVARFVDAFVANSASATEYLTDVLNVPRRRIVEGWWLAGMPREAGDEPGQPTQPVGRPPVVLAGGQLIPRKGFDLLIDGIARYRRDVGPCRLLLVGDGPERAALQAQVERLGLDDVDFLGVVPHEQMDKLMRSCDLFAFPTLFDLVGRVSVEALSVGTPVAASTLSGASGVLVRDGVNGVLMDPRDPASVTNALRRGLDPAINAQLREGARATSAHITPEVAAQHILTAVWRAGGRPRAGASR